MQKLDADRRRYIAFKDKEGLLNHLNERLRIFELTMKQRQLKQKQIDLSQHTENHHLKIK
jgi:hypothetical protein